MDAKQLADELGRSTARAVEALIEATAGKDGEACITTPFDLRCFAKSIANNIATGIAHRVVDEQRCDECGGELEAELMFVLASGRRLHPGCV
jgi:hypothetical protein